jgi:hypothetical protein
VAFAVLSAARLPLLPPKRVGPLTTLQTSLDAADRSVASPKGLLTLGFDPTRFQTEPPVCYRASWQLPGPDSHRQATTSTNHKTTPLHHEVTSQFRWAHESLRRNHGDAAGAKLGAKLIDRFAVNTGTIPHRSCCVDSIRVGGIDASSVEGAGWGGGPVVVRAGERPAHGEGGQQVGSESAGMSGGRW